MEKKKKCECSEHGLCLRCGAMCISSYNEGKEETINEIIDMVEKERKEWQHDFDTDASATNEVVDSIITKLKEMKEVDEYLAKGMLDPLAEQALYDCIKENK